LNAWIRQTVALLVVILNLTCIASRAADPDKAPTKPLPDYTTRLRLKPGMRITYQVHDGIDTRWKHIGDYEFSADIEPNRSEYAYSYKWSMTAPADAAGIRAVSRDDFKFSHKVSLFYPDKQNCALMGYTNIIRISDDLFKRLKRDDKTEFELDGPEVLQVYHKDSVPLPHSIKTVAEEKVDVMVNGSPATVRALKTETNNGWHYWVMDSAVFPIIVKADGPFIWDPPAFTNGDTANQEGRRIVNDLKMHGTATTQMILFDFDSDKLKLQSKVILNTVCQYLKQNPKIRLAIEGHCDIVGGYAYNMNLSMRRANSVRRYLVQNGISDGRFKSNGYGWTKPIADNKTAKGRALNRRVVFKVF
jgi:outer membrane protein OmpA-like peptidoglycan-associated protein